jgi:hypothetical protein
VVVVVVVEGDMRIRGMGLQRAQSIAFVWKISPVGLAGR